MYQFNIADVEAQVLDFMRANGCEPDDLTHLELDGQIHRYRVRGDKHSSKNGAYCIFTDNWPAGFIQDWKLGSPIKWRFEREHLDKEGKDWFNDERYKEACRLSEEHQKKLKAELEAKQKQASIEAAKLWDSLPAQEDFDFPYLNAKHISALGLRLWENNIPYGNPHNDELVVPLFNINLDIQSLQFIDKDGKKRFYTGAPAKGAFFHIGLDGNFIGDLPPDSPILLCEGFATAATIFYVTGHITVAAMTAGNLLPVALALKEKFPKRKIIILADNDRDNNPNTGITKAQEAVKSLNLAGYIPPTFEAHEVGSDWNDYYSIHGFGETYKLLLHKIEWLLRPDNIKALDGKVDAVNAQVLRNTVLPPIKWAVEGFLPSGLTILGGGPKVGKSILALHLALGVAIGGCVLGAINVEQGDVLYLALEDNKRRLQERMNSSNILPDDCDVSRLDFVTSIPRQHMGGLDYIKWWLSGHKNARLVIIDTLQKFRKELTGKAGVYGEDYDAIADIKAVADKFDVAVLVIHHLKKMSAQDEMTGDWINQFSGSAGLSGSADTLFVLKRNRSDCNGILRRTGRDVEEKDFAMRLDGFGWVLEGEAEDFTMPTWKKQILDYLKEHDTVTPQELSKALNLNPNTAQQNLRKLLKDGTLTKTGYGTYSKK